MNTKNDITRMTVELPTELHRKAKSVAALRGTTVRQLIIAGLDQQLEEAKDCPHPKNCKCKFNKATLKAMDEATKALEDIAAGKKPKNVKVFKNLEDFFHDLRS